MFSGRHVGHAGVECHWKADSILWFLVECGFCGRMELEGLVLIVQISMFSDRALLLIAGTGVHSGIIRGLDGGCQLS